MKHSRINELKAEYSTDGEQWNSIEQITKEDLLSIVEHALENEFCMDDPHESKIGNDAHKIIYSNIYEKLLKLFDERKVFKDECDSQFKEALEKYDE